MPWKDYHIYENKTHTNNNLTMFMEYCTILILSQLIFLSLGLPDIDRGGGTSHSMRPNKTSKNKGRKMIRFKEPHMAQRGMSAYSLVLRCISHCESPSHPYNIYIYMPHVYIHQWYHQHLKMVGFQLLYSPNVERQSPKDVLSQSILTHIPLNMISHQEKHGGILKKNTEYSEIIHIGLV